MIEWDVEDDGAVAGTMRMDCGWGPVNGDRKGDATDLP